jgi:hypothetical protein
MRFAPTKELLDGISLYPRKKSQHISFPTSLTLNPKKRKWKKRAKNQAYPKPPLSIRPSLALLSLSLAAGRAIRVLQPLLRGGLGCRPRGRGLSGRVPLRRAGGQLNEVVFPADAVPLRNPAFREGRGTKGGAFLAWSVSGEESALAWGSEGRWG